MERKIPVYVLLLVLFFGALGAVGFGAAVRQVMLGGITLGKFGQVLYVIAEYPSLLKRAVMEAYLEPQIIEDRFPALDGFKNSGRVPVDVETDDGYLLLSSYDSKRKQATVQLIRIRDQRRIYEWVPNIEELAGFEEKLDSMYSKKISPWHFRVGHPLLLEDGGLVFHNVSPLFKIDLCSNLEWSVEGVFHHSVERGDGGVIWVPSTLDPSSYEGTGIKHWDDTIAELSLDGRVLYKKSVSKILEENGYRGLLFSGSFNSDPIHLNDIQPVLEDAEFWKRGDLFLSLRSRSTVLLYRPKTNKIIWLKTGPWLNQHDVNIVGQSSITVFGNDAIDGAVNPGMWKAYIVFPDGHSNIYQFDFKTGLIKKPYSAILKAMDVRSVGEGRAKLLRNQDILVEETEYARMLLLTPDRVKWEYVRRVDEDHLAMLTWSRYLTEEQVKSILPKLESATCEK
jgi:hypothetical protein